jgi:hypothetical protein
MPTNPKFKSVRLPKRAPQDVREQFVGIVAAARSRFPLDRAIASVNAQIDRTGVVLCPIGIYADLRELVGPYVVQHRQPNKQKPPKA